MNTLKISVEVFYWLALKHLGFLRKLKCGLSVYKNRVNRSRVTVICMISRVGAFIYISLNCLSILCLFFQLRIIFRPMIGNLITEFTHFELDIAVRNSLSC